jgi:hypothetical protein
MKHITLRILAGLVVLAAIAGIALLAYNAGGAHQAALSAAPAAQNSSPAYPGYGPFWWPFPFLGFGFFGLLAVFFLFWVTFGALRFVLWGPRFGWRRWHHGYGRWGERGMGEEMPIPPLMAELHRRMHAADEGKPSDPSAQKQA